jgi:hypothetical protein
MKKPRLSSKDANVLIDRLTKEFCEAKKEKLNWCTGLYLWL